MSVTLYLEGGGSDSKELKIRCREGFRKLLENAGFRGKMPSLVACGSRNSAFGDFETALTTLRAADYVAMWIDSEDAVKDIEATWDHLQKRDPHWQRPASASDDQVLFMTTCMETLVIADRKTLESHYGSKLQASALPALTQLESRHRHAVHEALTHATRDCTNPYSKGKASFEILAKLDPGTLATHLASFARTQRILSEKLK